MSATIDAGWVDLEEGTREPAPPPRAHALLADMREYAASFHPEAASAAAGALCCCGLLWLLLLA